MVKFRDIAPIRTCTKVYRTYSSYKPYLAKDFSNKCGYTHCSDFWFGGKNNFHIDHFMPCKKFPLLKTEYNNLIYSCSYVNILKSDDLGTYLDPCNEDYNLHFNRTIYGAIIPISNEAKYMYMKMKLYLDRYRIIWILDQLGVKICRLQEIIEKTNDQEVKEIYIALSFKYNNYIQYLKATQ